jgi:DNA modification methylase
MAGTLMLHAWRVVEDRKQSDLWQVDRPARSELHPTMKPIELVQKSIVNSSKPGDIVIDSFGGSGSTLIACEQTNRKCRMVELDPQYCDVIYCEMGEVHG